MDAPLKRRGALVHREQLPSYAKPTRASITRTTKLTRGNEEAITCPHKGCNCSVKSNLHSKPTTPKTQPSSSSMLGKYRHDREGRMVKGKSYRSEQMRIHAKLGPSHLLQNRIRELARGIKDKRTNKETDEETEVPIAEKEPSGLTGSHTGDDTKIHGTANISTISEDAQDTGGNEEPGKLSSGDIDSLSRIQEEDQDQSDTVMTVTKQSNPPASPPRLQRTGRHPGVIKPHKRGTGMSEPLKLISENPVRGTDSLNHRAGHQLTPRRLMINKTSHTPLKLKERTDSDMSSSDSSSAIVEEVEPLQVEYPHDLPASYRAKMPSLRKPVTPLHVEYPPDLPARYRSHGPSVKESIASTLDRSHLAFSNHCKEPSIGEAVEPLHVEYPSDLPARYRTHGPTIREPVPSHIEPSSDLPIKHSHPASPGRESVDPLHVEYPSDLPARYRSQIPLIKEETSSSDTENPPDQTVHPNPKHSQADINLSPSHRFKPRRPSLLPTGVESPSAGAGRGGDRSKSVINISSAYRARRSSVFGLGLNTPRDLDAVSENGSISSASLQSHRASVADIFRRSKHSRHRRLSLFLQTSVSRKEQAIEKMKRVCRTVKIITGICLALKRYVKAAETKQWSLVEMQLNLRTDMEKMLAFDPVMFSKLRVTRGSEKLRSILSSKPSERSKDDISAVLALLRNNRTFADYDRDTQKALAKVMAYLRYESRRIILKEGHQASGYYIILSGTCLVNQKDIDTRNNQTFVRTINEIHSGDSFGSMELMNDCVRTASIVCKDECELLLVDKEDFKILIRDPLEKERGQLLDFCTKQNVFEKLPTNFDFREDHYAISAKKFKQGVVITSDINESDFIYVVRSGKCRVISEVKEVKDKQASSQDTRRKPLNNDEWKKEVSLKRSKTSIDSLGDRRKWISEPFQEKRQKTFFSLTGIKESTMMKRQRPSYNQRTIKEPLKLPKLTGNGRRHSVLKSVDFAESENEKKAPPIIPKSLFQDKDQLQTKPEEEEPTDNSGFRTTWRRVSMAASAVNEKQRRKNPLLYMKPNLLKSTYAEVAHLKEGDVFGVETLLVTGQSDTRLCLVSEGADCIVISKKFFATQATMSTIQQSTKMAIEYPSAQYTLDKIRQARAWSTYKDSLVKDVYNRKMFKVGDWSR